MKPSTAVRVAVAMLLLPTVVDAELLSVGDEFQVNSYTSGQQVVPDVAAAGAGGFVAVWNGLGGQDGYSNGVFGQRYASGAMRLGDEFQVNVYTLGSQGGPSVDSDAQGGFVVAWDSYGQDDSYFLGVFARRYDSNGQPISGEFQVNTYTPGDQGEPAIGVGPAGTFVVAWVSYGEPEGQDGNYGGIFAQRFDAGGGAVGTEFLVNTYTQGNQFDPVVAQTAAGNFVVVWAGGGPSGYTIHARTYDSAGQPTGAQYDVNDPTASSLRGPAIDALSGGGFAVAWQHDPASFEEDIHARLLDDDGAIVGSEFLVNTYTTDRQISADVAATDDGGFAVAWQSPEDGSGAAVITRLYDALGTPRGAPTQANVTTDGSQNSPALAETSPGELVAVWTSDLQDGSLQGIFGLRLVPFGTGVTGKKLLIKNPAAGAVKNKLVFLSKDSAVAAPGGVEEDPRCAPVGSGTPLAGATLRVIGLGGDFTIDLPCLGWTANASKTKYTYRDATGATCKRVTLRDGRLLKAVCKGSQVAYALGAPQSDVDVVLRMGEKLGYCATFGATTSADVKRDGSDGRTYKALNAAAPGACP